MVAQGVHDLAAQRERTPVAGQGAHFCRLLVFRTGSLVAGSQAPIHVPRKQHAKGQPTEGQSQGGAQGGRGEVAAQVREGQHQQQDQGSQSGNEELLLSRLPPQEESIEDRQPAEQHQPHGQRL